MIGRNAAKARPPVRSARNRHFDVWHGPAVISQGLFERVKEVADERYRVRRTAQPELDTNCGTVKVVYQMDREDRESGTAVRFSEEHIMRYLFPAEVLAR